MLSQDSRMNTRLERSILMHEWLHSIGMQNTKLIESPLQRQINVWVKLGAARQDGKEVIFSEGSWGHREAFTPMVTLRKTANLGPSMLTNQNL